MGNFGDSRLANGQLPTESGAGLIPQHSLCWGDPCVRGSLPAPMPPLLPAPLGTVWDKTQATMPNVTATQSPHRQR